MEIDANQWWSWVLTITGVSTFILAGRKVWWSWYVGLVAQVLWLAYALITMQWGFLVGVVVYSVVYTQNTIAWTREHRQAQAEEQPETA